MHEEIGMPKLAAAIASVCAALFLSAGAFAYQSETVTNGGTISGVVKFEGPPPKPQVVQITKDKEVCGAKPTYNEDLVVDSGGGIRYAVATITDISKGAPVKPEEAKFDQIMCRYTPHVLAFPAGSTVDVINSDGILHNVHTYPGVNPPVNMAQPGFKKVMPVVVEKPDVIKVTCDAHGWMKGWWYVTANPYYAVTDEHGEFTIRNVPPGTYTLEVWQEELDKETQRVSVKPGQTTNVTFAFKPGKG
jgi:plastocyanin